MLTRKSKIVAKKDKQEKIYTDMYSTKKYDEQINIELNQICGIATRIRKMCPFSLQKHWNYFFCWNFTKSSQIRRTMSYFLLKFENVVGYPTFFCKNIYGNSENFEFFKY